MLNKGLCHALAPRTTRLDKSPGEERSSSLLQLCIRRYDLHITYDISYATVLPLFPEQVKEHLQALHQLDILVFAGYSDGLQISDINGGF